MEEELIISLKVDKTKELSEDQKNGLTYLINWVKENKNIKSEDMYCSLTGAAGTGKTTLISYFLDLVSTEIPKHKICICAPTHKAKKVIQDKTKWKTSETLQALLGLKLDVSMEDFDINNPSFNPIGDRKIKDFKLVIIDESSMVNKDLYLTIKDCAKSTGTLVLFVGDSKQLNPVKENNVSLALIGCNKNYNLTQVVRQQNDNPLIEVLDCLRLDIENGTSNYIDLLKDYPSKFNNRNEGFAVLKGADFAQELKNHFKSEEFKNDKNYCRFIAWTNQCISNTNSYIRSNIMESQGFVDVDDILLGYRTVADKEFTYLTNSDDYFVEEIKDSVKVFEGIPIECLNLHIKAIDNDLSSYLNVVKPTPKNLETFSEIFENILLDAKTKRSGKAWREFYEFKDEFLLMTPLLKNNTLLCKKDLDFGYGLTIHKSQGSTYNTVFISGKDINKNFVDNERKKLWYVALSRASNKVYISL
jgi:hypothetical protein